MPVFEIFIFKLAKIYRINKKKTIENIFMQTSDIQRYILFSKFIFKNHAIEVKY